MLQCRSLIFPALKLDSSLPSPSNVLTHQYEQLYIAGEFVGGADIVVQMSTNGELKTLLAAARSK